MQPTNENITGQSTSNVNNASTGMPEVLQRVSAPTVITPGSATAVPTQPLAVQAPQPEPLKPANSLPPSPPKMTVSPSALSAPTFGNNYLDEIKVKGHGRVLIFGLIILLVLVIVGSMLYFLILPPHYDNNYLAAVKNKYSMQSAEMLDVYESFSRPAFSSNSTSQQQSTTDLSYTGAVLKTALSYTNSLKSADHLSVLPGTTIIHSVGLTNAQYKAMQQYINDSDSLIYNYQTLVTYIGQFLQITQTQTPQFLASLEAAAGSKTVAEYLTNTQNAQAQLTALITSLNALHAPTDLMQFNSTLLSNLSSMNADMQSLISGIQDNDATQVKTAASQLITDAQNLNTTLNTNIAGLLQNNSSIHNEIVKLEGENPLGQSSKSNIINKPTSTNTAT